MHAAPHDLKQILTASRPMRTTWEDITPLAKNEWICWITSAKKPETRERRLRIAREKLSAGTRRPCCFAGCPHR